MYFSKSCNTIPKIVCGTVGIGILGGTVTGVGIGTYKRVNYIMEKRSESKSINKD